MLDKLRFRMERESITNVHPVFGFLGTGDLDERDVYERAILAMVLGETRDRAGALAEIHAALKPGGILSITEVSGDPDYRTKKILLDEAESAGFELVRLFEGRISFTMNLLKRA